MKTYDELTEEQQAKAVEREVGELLRAILQGLRFDDAKNGDDLQARIDRAAEKAEEMQTPWFTHEYILEDDACKEAVEGIARAAAEDAIYLEAGEHAAPVPK